MEKNPINDLELDNPFSDLETQHDNKDETIKRTHESSDTIRPFSQITGSRIFSKTLLSGNSILSKPTLKMATQVLSNTVLKNEKPVLI